MSTLAFFRPGFWELAVILLIVLLLFGAAKLPHIGKALGQAVKGFKKAADGKEESKESDPTANEG